jgi:hypothetical protein
VGEHNSFISAIIHCSVVASTATSSHAAVVLCIFQIPAPSPHDHSCSSTRSGVPGKLAQGWLQPLTVQYLFIPREVSWRRGRRRSLFLYLRTPTRLTVSSCPPFKLYILRRQMRVYAVVLGFGNQLPLTFGSCISARVLSPRSFLDLALLCPYVYYI